VEVVKGHRGPDQDKGRVERGWLGVGIGQDENGRTFIGSVDPESPAELAKLRLGDVVLKIGDKDVSGPDVLAAEIRRRKPGQEVTLKIEREGQPLDVKVKLGELAEDEAFKEMDLRFPGSSDQARPNPVNKEGAQEPHESDDQAERTPRLILRVLGGPSRREIIGLYCGELNPELAAHFGVKDGTALIVSKLTEGGPAAKAKLQVGDIIVSVDGRRVGSVNELIDRVQTKEKGTKIKLDVLRDKKPMTFEVEVAEDESGGPLGSDGLQTFLESWQGYTDALQNELKIGVPTSCQGCSSLKAWP
jgi:S1-C subfamily serine protease